MSGWSSWVDFVAGHCNNEYTMAASYPCAFNLGIGGKTGDIWAVSTGFSRDGLDAAACKRMVDAVDADDVEIFSTPPTGYTFLRTVESNGLKVLCGRAKGVTGKVIFAAVSTTCMHIAICDIQNSNKGAEAEALNAFSKAVNKAIENNL